MAQPISHLLLDTQRSWIRKVKVVLILVGLLATLLSWLFVLKNNSLTGWIGVIFFGSFTSVELFKRMDSHYRPALKLLVLLFVGLLFTINGVYVSPWWLAYWPVTFIYLLSFSLLRINNP